MGDKMNIKRDVLPTNIKKDVVPTAFGTIEDVFNTMGGHMNTAFGGMFDNFPSIMGRQLGYRLPRSEIEELKDAYRIRVEVPGVPSDKIVVTLSPEGRQLAVNANITKENKGDGSWHTNSYYRCFSLAAPLTEEDVSATYRNGVLELLVGKTPQQEHALRTIAVKTR